MSPLDSIRNQLTLLEQLDDLSVDVYHAAESELLETLKYLESLPSCVDLPVKVTPGGGKKLAKGGSRG